MISFQAETIAEAKKQLPELPMFFLSGFRKSEESGEWTPSIDDLISQAKAIDADGLDLNYRGPFDRELVQRVKDAGLGLFVWTVDDPEVAKKLVEIGVDGITTNRADWLRDQLAAP